MPTYDYQCRRCGNTIEVIHSMLEDGPAACERCGGEVRRILHPAGIIFRGSGFYKTDSRSASSASVPAGPTKPASGSAEKKDGGASESGSVGKGGGASPGGGTKPEGGA